MLKILLVDSWLLNNKVIEQDTEKYFNSHHIEYEFFECVDPKGALKTVQEHQIDIAYIDISSDKFDGIQLLKDIKSLDIRQPKIIAVTVLYDKKYRYEALRLKVYRYIYKPYDGCEIETSLSNFFNENNYSIESNSHIDALNSIEDEIKTETEDSDDDFFDFEDDDEFMDFEDEEIKEDGVEHSKELMDAYNQSHKQVTADEFLELYSAFGYDVEELSELEEELDSLVASILYDEDLEDKMPDIVSLLGKYNSFLYMFSEFEELCKVLYAMIELLNTTDFASLKRKKMVAKFIIAIIEDLVDWKEHVFVLEDAVDVYYINASILNSFVLLKDVINK